LLQCYIVLVMWRTVLCIVYTISLCAAVLTVNKDDYYMLEMSASSEYQYLICRRTEMTHQKRVNSLNHVIHWTCGWRHGASVHLLAFVMEADISRYDLKMMWRFLRQYLPVVIVAKNVHVSTALTAQSVTSNFRRRRAKISWHFFWNTVILYTQKANYKVQLFAVVYIPCPDKRCHYIFDYSSRISW